MKVISILSSKGGAGKTTIAKCLLSAAAHAGMKTCFVECDQNNSLLSWASNAAKNDLWPNSIEAYQALTPDALERVMVEIRDEESYDLTIIDTEGRASEDHHRFVFESDLILVPMLLSRTDIEVTRNLLNWLHRLPNQVDRPDLLPEYRVVLNSTAGKSPSKTEIELLKLIGSQKLVGDSLETPVTKIVALPSIIRAREAYRIMDTKGPIANVIEDHNRSVKGFQKNPVYLVDALVEATTLLNAALNVMRD